MAAPTFLGLKYGNDSVMYAARPEGVTATPAGSKVGVRITDGAPWYMRIVLGWTMDVSRFILHRAKYGITQPFTIPCMRPVYESVFNPSEAPAVVLSANAAKDADSMTLRLSEGSLAVPEGVVFSLPGHPKVYMVDGDETITASGVEIAVVPRLRIPVAAGVRINFLPDAIVRYAPTSPPPRGGNLRPVRPVLEVEEVAA